MEIVHSENRPSLPTQFELAWPLLRVLQAADGPMTNKAMEAAVADDINLTTEQREVKRSPRGIGSRTLLDYKLGWSRTILKNMGAIHKVASATWVVTDVGRQTAKADIDKYNKASLDRLEGQRGTDA